MRQALAIAGSLGLMLSGCGEKRTVQAATAPPVQPSEVGIASWYGHPYHGRAAASGEIYDMQQLTAAHRTLPFGTWVHVINLDNDKTVEVRINDRGPFASDRIIDLSQAAARAIGMIGPGTARVRLEVAGTPASLTPGSFAVQVGAFQYRANAERLRAEMEASYGAARLVERPGDPTMWRVLVGREATMDSALALADRIRSGQNARLGQAFVVRDDVLQTAANTPSI